MAKKKTKKQTTLIKRLFERRMPQIVFIYFGVCWTILEFLNWLVEHYQLSPYFTDLGLIILLSLLPTVGMLAYFHGRPGRDVWTKTEKIGIPANIVCTLALVYIVFSGKELGSATTQVTVRDELGQVVRRKMPKSDFNRRLAIFFFENKSGNPDLDYLQSALMFGCHLDLSQDPVFSLYSAYDNVIYQRIRQAGLKREVGLPMMLEKKIAGELQREYFLGGSFTTAGDTLIVSTYLYETVRGKLLTEHVYRTTKALTVVDQITRDLKQDLKLPVWHIEGNDDLPVSEMLTNSPAACRAYFTGADLANLKFDLRGAIPYFEKAVAADPTFALAHWMLYSCYSNTAQSASALSALQATLQHLYKLPEILQFAVKQEHYLVTENPDKGFAILEMWVKLYPRDLRAHFRLANAYLRRNQPEQVIKEYKIILQLDPTRRYYLQYIGDVYRIRGDFKNALKYLTQYSAEFPKDYRSFAALGELYFTMGNYPEARQYFSEALVMAPEDINLNLQSVAVELECGNFATVERLYHEVLKQTTSAQDLALIYDALQKYYRRRGQLRNALQARENKFVAQSRFALPLEVALNKLYDGSFEYFLQTGAKSQAVAQIKQIERQLFPPWSRALAAGKLEIALAEKDYPSAHGYLNQLDEALRIFDDISKKHLVHHARGCLAEAQADYLTAILEYQQDLTFQPTDVTVLIDIARCYRLLGENGRARTLLETTLKVQPFNPDANLEMARICHALQDNAAARKHLDTALQVWEKADPDFTPAQEARSLRQQLSNSLS